MLRIAILIDKNSTAGSAANISALLMGQAALIRPEIYNNEPVFDLDIQKHAAIRYSTVILEAGSGQLIALCQKVAKENQMVSCVIFSQVGQGLHNAFEEYKSQVASASTENTRPVGIILVGDDIEIRKLTKKYSVLK